MPPSDTQDERRGGKLLTVLFWAGVGLAPLAALLLLVGQGEGPLRVAAVLAVLAVVLIGLSITLRRDSESVRLELEETLLDEIDLLREDVRADITTAARATHRAFGEKLQALHASVEAMRGQVEAAARAELPRGGYGPAESRASSPSPPAVTATASTNGGYQQSAPRVAQHSGIPASAQPGVASGTRPGVAVAGVAMPAGGRVQHTETVHVTTRQTIVDQHTGDVGQANGYSDTGRANGYSDTGRANGYGDAGRANGYGDGGRASGYGDAGRANGYGEAARANGHGDAGRANGYGAGNGYPGAGRADAYGDQRTGGHAAGAAGVAGVQGAAYNRTAEPPSAVRPSSAMPSSAMPSSAMPSSAVPSSAMPSSGMPGGGRHGDWSGQPRGRAPQHGEASGSDHRQRERTPDPQASGFRGADSHVTDPHGPDPRLAAARGAADARRPRPHEAGGEESWSDVRAGDRWASVRTDDRGREMRMGERRAAVHTDQSGTELRVEDRWASVRQQEPRQQEPRWEDQQRGQPSWEEPRRDEWRHDEGPRSGGPRSEGRPSEGRRAAPRQHADQWAPQPAAQWSQEQQAAQWSPEPLAAQWSQERQAAQWSPEPQAGRGEEAAWSQPRWEQERAGGQPALPAAPAEPAAGWSQGWAQPDPVPASGGRRRRAEPEEDQYGYRIAQPDGPPPARTRRVDFELSDERWR